MIEFSALSDDGKIGRIISPDFWRSINPHMHITDSPFKGSSDYYSVDSNAASVAQEQVAVDGYGCMRDVIRCEDVRNMANTIEKIVDVGIMPIFAAIYDEFWQILHRQSKLLTPILGEEVLIEPVIWVWYIPANQDASGWQPHRDAPFSRNGYRADWRPKFLTTWTPLTNADVYNSCMYVLPHSCDPAWQCFRAGNSADDAKKLNQSWQLSSIRALPTDRGDILFWDGDVLHWGGRSSQWAEGPRMSMSSYYRSKDMQPFFSPFDKNMREINYNHSDTMVTFENRLTIIANVLNFFKAPGQTLNEPNFGEIFQKFGKDFCYK